MGRSEIENEEEEHNRSPQKKNECFRITCKNEVFSKENPTRRSAVKSLETNAGDADNFYDYYVGDVHERPGNEMTRYRSHGFHSPGFGNIEPVDDSIDSYLNRSLIHS